MVMLRPRLPAELLVEVINQAQDDTSTLKALSLVNSLFRDTASRFLYEKVTIGGSQAHAIEKLKALSSDLLAKYVKVLTILASAGNPPEEAQARRRFDTQSLEDDERKKYSEIAPRLCKGFCDFFHAAGSLCAIQLDFQDRGGRENLYPEIAQISLMVILSFALRCVELRCLTSLVVNQVVGRDLEGLFGIDFEDQVIPLMLGGITYQLKQQTLRNNLGAIRSVEIEYKGGYELPTGSPRKDSHPMLIFNFLAGKLTAIENLKIYGLGYGSGQFWSAKGLESRFSTTLTSLTLIETSTCGLSLIIRDCTRLRSMSLTRIDVTEQTLIPVPGAMPTPSWCAIFKDCMRLELESFHAESLVQRLFYGSTCYQTNRTIQTSKAEDIDSFMALVRKVLASGGIFTRGSNRIQVTELNDDIGVCLHDGGGVLCPLSNATDSLVIT